MHILSDANGLPLLVGISAANTHDGEGLKPMVEGHQTRHDPHNARYFNPQRLHADKAYDRADLRRWLRWKRIGVRIARKGIESSERLGRRRRVIERTMSRLSGYLRWVTRTGRRRVHRWSGCGGQQVAVATGADVDPGPVVVARALRPCPGAVPVPGGLGQAVGEGVRANGGAAVVDPDPRGAGDGHYVTDAAFLQGGRNCGSWP